MKDHDSLEEVEKRAKQSDPIVMYLIVNEGLGMSIGKTAAQCAHASQMLLMKYQEYHENNIDDFKYGYEPTIDSFTETYYLFKEWLTGSFRKVILKADNKEWENIKKEFPEEMRVIVIDAGLTQLNPGTPTVIGLFPMRKSNVPKIVKRLQAL